LLGVVGELDSFKLQQRPFLDPVGTISEELQALIQALVATLIMARIERRQLAEYGIPAQNALGCDFRIGLGWAWPQRLCW
jgi:hypothetical protein